MWAMMCFLSITLVLPALLLLPATTEAAEGLDPETSPGFPQRLGELVGVNDTIPCIQKRCMNTKTMKTDPVPDVEYLAQFAAATYCDSVIKSPHVPSIIGCSKGVCPDLMKNGVILLSRFSRGITDTTGIVAIDKKKEALIVAFRGSKSVRNWIVNFQISKTAVPQYCPGCEVHTGFYKAFQDSWPDILLAVESAAMRYPTFKIVCVGHSLGGAIASITATELRKRFKNVVLYSYGAPRIGNGQFSIFVTNNGTNYRFTHLNDPIPQVPRINQGYKHISPEYFISSGDHNIIPEDVRILHGGVNHCGNTNCWLPSANISAHRYYFLPVAINTCSGYFLSWKV